FPQPAAFPSVSLNRRQGRERFSYFGTSAALRFSRGEPSVSDITDIKPIEVISKEVSRRNFIKGVIASGAAVSSANYLFRATTLFGQTPGASATERLITINVNGQQRRVDVLKQETLAWTLRYKL